MAESFNFFEESARVLLSLPPENAGVIVQALFAERLGETAPELDALSGAVCALIKGQLDRAESVRQSRAASGKSGGQKSKSKQTKANESNHQASATKPEANRTTSTNTYTGTNTVLPPPRTPRAPDPIPIELDPKLAAVAEAFSANLHPPTPMEADMIREWVKTAEPELILTAIKEAAMQGGRSPKYADRILASLHAAGITTKAGYDARERDRAGLKARDPHGGARASPRMSTAEQFLAMAERYETEGSP